MTFESTLVIVYKLLFIDDSVVYQKMAVKIVHSIDNTFKEVHLQAQLLGLNKIKDVMKGKIKSIKALAVKPLTCHYLPSNN